MIKISKSRIRIMTELEILFTLILFIGGEITNRMDDYILICIGVFIAYFIQMFTLLADHKEVTGKKKSTSINKQKVATK